MTRVLVLGGGPDAEREVSLESSRAVYEACKQAGLDAQYRVVDRPNADEVAAFEGEVIFPVLHGRFGEGGELQAMLEAAGRRFVGSGSRAAKIAMDKMGTKLLASRLGIPTPRAAVLDPADATRPEIAVCPLVMPVVIKPVAEGSSVGLHICEGQPDWVNALGKIEGDRRVYMIEQRIVGRELTVGIIEERSGGLGALPVVEISPSEGVYDYEAKYARGDTVYAVNPDLSARMGEKIQEQSVRLCEQIGVRHLARVDFLVPDDGSEPMLLEVNTMPGFTGSSLLPMASRAAGRDMAELCAHLVSMASCDEPER